MTSETIQAIHVSLEGYTAFFRHTGIISGTQLTLPCPPYSTILGLISGCADKTVCPRDTKIGYEFNHVSVAEDLERTNRFMFKADKLKKHTEGQGIVRRQTHFRPTLDLYLTNLDLASAFTNPVAVPTLGRSQDLCWINKVEEVRLTSVKSGMIGSTMIGSKGINASIPSDIVPCTEWFTNDETGYTRNTKEVKFYQATNPDDGRIRVEIDNLYHPSNMPNEEDVIYLHQWSAQ